jgi:hypothetical protein
VLIDGIASGWLARFRTGVAVWCAVMLPTSILLASRLCSGKQEASVPRAVKP